MAIAERAIRALVCSGLLAALAACGGNARAPVEDRYSRSATSGDSSYAVQRGDTLYSIAFRYGLDYRKLGAANGIGAPYVIYPGQRLLLKEAAVPVTTAASPAPKSVARTAPTPSVPATEPRTAPVTPVSSKPATTSSGQKATAVAMGPVSRWRWPSGGPVVRRYSSTVHKGIDIGGQRGDPVEAVANGQVVYAGTGIVGLGELLIVKHNEVYLSAYGHNQRLLVSEGDTVKAGQRIAEKGSSGTDSVRLHFEIRKAGKPIDPLRLLPRR